MSASDEVTVVVYDVFTVADTVSATSGGTFNGGITGTTATFSGDLTVNTSTLKVDAANNRVGIGEASPAAPLHIETGTTEDIIRFGANGRWGFQRANSDSRYLSFSRAMNGTAVDMLTFDGDNSYIGINTDDPFYPLDIAVNAFDGGRRLGVSYADNIVSVSSHGGNGGLENLSVRGDNIMFYSDYDVGNLDGVERMRLTSSGNLSIGTTSDRVGGVSADGCLNIVHATSGKYALQARADNTGGHGIFVRAGNSQSQDCAKFTGYDENNVLLKIDGIGQFTHTTDLNSLAGIIANKNSTPYGIYLQFTAAAPNNTDNYFLAGLDTSSNRIKLFSSGTVKNSTGTYTSFSDERLKSDIVDAKSQWEDIKALNFKNFIKFDNPDFKQLGLIAQDVEKTSPNLVFETPPEPEEIKHSSVFGTLYEDGDELPENKKVGDVKEVKSQVKNVKDSILYMKAVKALQEAMTRIETLEAKVKALEEA